MIALRRLVPGAVLAAVLASCAPGPTVPEKVEGPAETLPQPPKAVADSTRVRLEAAIRHVAERDLTLNNGFWTVFHGILGLGPSVTLLDPLTNQRVNAIDYVSDGKPLRGLVFLPTAHGLDVQMGPIMVGQGHQDQFVAEMIQWGMPAERRFVVLGKDYTFLDFIRHSQMRASVKKDQELDWAIIVVAHHFGTDAEWTNQFGEHVKYEDTIRYVLDQPMEPAACGGTHRLFGLAWAYYVHRAKGGNRTGVWKEIAEYTEKYRTLARKYKNGDGSFSTEFFRGPGNAQDRQLRINTTGHVLEWLALALEDAELREPWVENAANALALMILDMQDASIDGGPLYHAVHGLILYYARRYDGRLLGANDPYFPPKPPGGFGVR